MCVIDEATLEKLLTAQQYHTAAWNEVISLARQYHQMKTHGSYIERGKPGVTQVCFGDQKRFIEMFHRDLLTAIERACLEDALLGQALAKRWPQKD